MLRGREDVFEVVFVCTGNRARSPLAEALYRRYSEGAETVVTSYGTSDVGLMPPLPQAVEAAATLGVDLSGHRARTLRRGSLGDADLVLGFEPFHQAVAVVEGGAPAAHTFLLAELVSLLEEPFAGSVSETDARAAVAYADSRRVRSRPAAEAAIADPIGRPDDMMSQIATQIDDLVAGLVHGLLGLSTGPGK